MKVSYEQGTLLWYWFENWIVVGGFAVAVMVAVLVAARSSWGIRGLLFKALMLVAAGATLPLTLIRLGLDITVSVDALTMGYLSLAGAGGSLVVGLSCLLGPRRLTNEEWARSFAPQYRNVAMVCDHFDSKNDQNASGEEQMTAMALVLTEFPPILKAIQASKLRSRGARRARRSFEKAIRRYLSTAKLGNQLFEELQKGVADYATWESTSRAARERIMSRISSRLVPARQDLAKARAYFERISP